MGPLDAVQGLREYQPPAWHQLVGRQAHDADLQLPRYRLNRQPHTRANVVCVCRAQ